MKNRCPPRLDNSMPTFGAHNSLFAMTRFDMRFSHAKVNQQRVFWMSVREMKKRDVIDVKYVPTKIQLHLKQSPFPCTLFTSLLGGGQSCFSDVLLQKSKSADLFILSSHQTMPQLGSIWQLWTAESCVGRVIKERIVKKFNYFCSRETLLHFGFFVDLFSKPFFVGFAFG